MKYGNERNNSLVFPGFDDVNSPELETIENDKDLIFTITIPSFVTSANYLNKGGVIFLPNLLWINLKLKKYFSIISQYYKLFRLNSLAENPLFLATEMIGISFINNLQNESLLQLNEIYPFFKLVVK